MILVIISKSMDQNIHFYKMKYNIERLLNHIIQKEQNNDNQYTLQMCFDTVDNLSQDIKTQMQAVKVSKKINNSFSFYLEMFLLNHTTINLSKKTISKLEI